MPNPIIKRILIKIPSSLYLAYGSTVENFEQVGADYYLRLPLRPGEYVATKNYATGAPKLIRTFTTPKSPVKMYTYEVEVKTPESRACLYFLVQAVMRAASADLNSSSSIRVLDLCFPEVEDTLSASATVEAVTARDVLLKELRAGGAVVENEGVRFIQGGFSFKLEELKMRRD